MVYNYNREKHAFDQRWTYLHKVYSHAGMSETAIADIYKFDKEEFNCTRREREHALVSLDSPNFEEGSCGLDLFALGYYTCDSYSTVPENMLGSTRFRTKHCMAVSYSCPVMIRSC